MSRTTASSAFAMSLAAVLFAAVAPLALAETVKDEFDRLFGAEVKRVSASADPADDIELAQQLLSAAKGSTDKPAMRDHLCEYAFALGSRDPAGYPVAVEAMQFVAENAGDDASGAAKKAECENKIAMLYQRGYERTTGDKKAAAGEQYLGYLVKQADAKIAAKNYGEAINLLRRARPVAIAIKSEDKDAIQAKLDTCSQLVLITNKIEAAEKKLAANPWDKVSHAQLVELYLTDMDDPAKASKHLEIGGDETQKKLVPLAAKSVLEIDEAQALTLADYYEGLSKKGLPQTRLAMLTRSKGYYEHYMTLHTAEDVQRTAAAVNLKRISDALEKLEAELGPTSAKKPETDGKTIDLLDYIDPQRDAQSGRWTRIGDAIRNERGGFTDVPLIRPPVRVDGGSYSLKIKFTRDTGAGGGNIPNVPGFGTAGEGSIGFIFPVGASQVSYVINAIPSGASGLAEISGQGPDRNGTRKDVSITTGKVHAVDVVVKVEAAAEGESAPVAIAISFDGKSVLEWKGKESDLALNNILRVGDNKAFAFTAYNAGITLGSAKLKMTSGKAETLEKPVDKSVKAETAKNNDKAPPANRDDERREREKRIEDFFKGRGKGR